MPLLSFYRIFCLLGLLTLSTQAFSRYPFTGNSFKGFPCANTHLIPYGPFDYKTAARHHILVVLDYHFTPELRFSEGDLDYTLGALPNYHPALLNIVKLYLRNPKKYGKKEDIRATALRPVECYFYRALQFRPQDYKTYSLFAYFLYKLKKYEEAEDYYKQAIEINKKDAESYYNLGLLLVTLKRYKEARKYAKLAYKYKYPFKGLKKRLAKAGYPL